LEWRVKVELFEEIRREYEFGEGTILGVSLSYPMTKKKWQSSVSILKRELTMSGCWTSCAVPPRD
jgi:hypothetical protein